jgi:hypothetical protein
MGVGLVVVLIFIGTLVRVLAKNTYKQEEQTLND